MTAALVVDRIAKKFGNHQAVDAISFEVPAGKIFGILGPNGAGKSTTMRMINDIIMPDSGTITILGTHHPGPAAAAHIGYLPEERGLYPKMKVKDMVSFMGELRGLSVADAKARAHKWLERLGLAQWLNNKVQDLSKGMQQKVQFATALIHEPQLVILDEPWSGLDPINAEVLRDVVEEIRAQGRTVMFSTHQMEQAEKICDHVCIIARGKKVLDGELVQIKKAAADAGLISLGFADDTSKQRAEAPIADRSLIAEQREPRAGDVADVEVKLADGVTSQQLLAALLGANVALRKFEVLTPSLHQIFVERVGGDAAQIAERRDA